MFSREPERFHRLVGIGKRVARPGDAHDEISGRFAITSSRYASACRGVSTVLVTPGRLSFMQSYLRLQKLHWMLQRGATGR